MREAEQRTRSALESSNEPWPLRRAVANLAPGALPKEGTHFDLPLAVGIVAAQGGIEAERIAGWVVIGELALDGEVRRVRGALAAALVCRASGARGLICPRSNAGEAALVTGLEVVGVASLSECVGFLRGEVGPRPIEPDPPEPAEPAEDLLDVRGHPAAKRALEIAASGGHNLLLVGPPGSGKTMLARRLPGILPPLSDEEALEVTRVLSVAGLLGERPHLERRRPFRDPHHHVSVAGLIGGGSGLARPGEASLAHHGVLFLDELALFRREVLETLRAPLEEGVVRIARSGGAITYPCRLSLVAAMNPCPCGYLGDWRRGCRCPRRQLELYRGRLSGPLLDRFDLHATMTRLRRAEAMAPRGGEASATVAARVARARSVQTARYGCHLVTNASVPKARLEDSLRLSRPARAMLDAAVDSLALTGRGLDRVLRVALTLSDMAGRDVVSEDHVGEALSYRAPDGAGDAP